MRKKVLEILNLIHKGELTIRWRYWFFSGGRPYGEGHQYDVFKKGEAVYMLALNDSNGLDIRKANSGESICLDFDDENIVKMARDVLNDAIKRDDTQIVAIMTTKDGKFLGLPCGYEDITREDVLEGRWSDVRA